ncbi:hypothetical protein [Virgibacillus sp. MG-45]|uniref:hypothetical protein n=1 Tax=Virgibacillus sp. MG-45 TaxID=3102791 RepID=UPI002ED7F6F5
MNKAIFLDRDGVVNEVLTDRVKFVNKPADVYLLPRVGEAIKRFNDAGFMSLSSPTKVALDLVI